MRLYPVGYCTTRGCPVGGRVAKTFASEVFEVSVDNIGGLTYYVVAVAA
jgi:hypothetical protein